MKIIKGKQVKPRRVLLYGTHGVGKSTWAASAPAPIFLQTEEGLDDIGADRSPLCRTFGDLANCLSWLMANDHQYQTVVLDTLDWTERLVHAATCEKHGKKSIEDFGYGRGYTFSLRVWEWLRNELQGLRDNREMNVILLAHARVTRFEDPAGAAYDRYEPDMHKTVSPMWQEWCDEVLFTRHLVATVKQDEGYGRERTRGIGTGERVCYTTEMATHLAKRRIAMPDQIPLSWEEYAKHWPGGGNIAGVVVNGSSKQGAK